MAVENGEEALKLLLERKFDLVLSDIQMPKMNGIQLIKELKRHAIEVPIILLTGVVEKAYVVQALRLGVTDFLDKPFSAKKVKDSIAQVLEMSKRKEHIQLSTNNPAASADEVQKNKDKLEKEKKMLGLLQVYSTVKKED